MQHTIGITGIETKATKTGNTKVILLTDGKGKFHFYQKQKNGKSPAFVQFEKFDFKIGDTVDVDSQDEEKTFTNEGGEEITFTEHWIQKFCVVDGSPTTTGIKVPKATENVSEVNLDPIPDILRRIGRIEQELFKEIDLEKNV